ncbi:nitroreductase family deazaflavin-dependent oxidoreductase [Rhodococcus rhodnii]|nr:nitroreductase family deazaflavin-dependent oxidoreductase [Rhodococcus rhodnii]TXG92754.1 nitroreductase family deazaflavin-dependent oxidoreductase [Rhodococcus rhodnii]
MPLKGEYVASPAEWAAEQVETIESSDGAEGNTLRGMPVVVVTSIGAKSGKLRKTPLMRVEHDGVYGIVASLGGAPKNPVWYYNVKADPRVELRDGSTVFDGVAREVTGDERETWWKRAVEAYPDYADYQRKTSRTIPLFVVERAEQPHDAKD